MSGPSRCRCKREGEREGGREGGRGVSGGDERVHAADCPLPRVQSKEKREPKFTSYSPPLPPYLITRLILIIKNFCRGVPEPQKNRRGVRDRVLVVHKAEVGGRVVW